MATSKTQKKPPDFDCAEALDRFDQRMDIYLKAADIFIKNARLSAGQLNQYFASGQISKTLPILHTLKGDAETIGAIKLHEIAKMHESEIKQGRIPSQDLFDSILEETLASLEALLHES